MNNASTMEQVLACVEQLPPLSTAVVEVLASFERKDVDADEIAGKISLDQGMVTRVLRVANSAFYGFNGKVGTIHEAIVLLGFHNIRSLVVAAGLIRQFPPREHGQFDHNLFWRHNIGTGVCARVLASRLGKDGELAFTAGMLHDVGQLVVEVVCPEKSDAVAVHGASHDMTLLEAERAILGVDHAAIGFEVTKRWNFPAAIQLAIRDHHQPGQESGFLADVVHVASVLCHALDIGNTVNDRVTPLSPDAWQRLGLHWEMIKYGLPEIERQNAAASLMLGD
ncbi:MAG: HDOD domain-containing protein [Nitrosomonadales bacterium]|nr:HDOD domain-containing protein [Nitrosomonadales bacterium]